MTPAMLLDLSRFGGMRRVSPVLLLLSVLLALITLLAPRPKSVSQHSAAGLKESSHLLESDTVCRGVEYRGEPR